MPVRGGRPNRNETRRRELLFAELLAVGKTPRAAGREARIDPWRAFKLGTSAEFWKLVHDLRAERPADTDG
ncbi:MAG TPA: hypothetical protein VNI55_06605 [Gaiellaceae bacterium]|nr:hypothetical protein [Gaiellaceae bacterium]